MIFSLTSVYNIMEESSSPKQNVDIKLFNSKSYADLHNCNIFSNPHV